MRSFLDSRGSEAAPMPTGHKRIADQFGSTSTGGGPAVGDWLNGLNGPQIPVLSPNPGAPNSLPYTSEDYPVAAPESQTVLFNPDASTVRNANPIGGSTSSGPASASTSTPTAASGFTINISWDASVASAPSGFTSGVLSAVQYLESQFSNPVTLNIDVGYGEVNGTALGSGTLGASEWYLDSVGYSQLVGALSANAVTSAATTAVASLPSTVPVNGTFWTTAAQAKALGLAPATGSSIDGYVGFSSSYPFTYSDSAGVAAGTYDFTGTVLHELTEVMGRALLTGTTVGSTPNSYTAYDLFHYSGAGTRDFSASTPGYFSVDGGTTDLAAFNTQAGGDAGDWASSVTNDAFDAFSSPGVVNAVSHADLTALNVIGWTPASSTNATAPTAPTTAPSQPPGFAAIDTTTGQPATSNVKPYSGPVAGLQEEYINITSDNLNIAVSTDNWFIHSGSGTDAIAVHGGTNVLDGGTGSNFLTGGSGNDTFFVDTRAANADTWSTIVGFHSGDAATIWGVTLQDFSFNWVDNQGAAGYTGLTLHATAASKPTASITLVGYNSSDLNNGRLSVRFGVDQASGSPYMNIW